MKDAHLVRFIAPAGAVRSSRFLWLLLPALAVLLGGPALTARPLRAAGTTYYVGTVADDAGTNTARCASATNTDCSMRSALSAASSGADTVQFRSGLSGTIIITRGALTLTRNVTITGPGAAGLAVRGNPQGPAGVSQGPLVRVNGGVTAAISGLTLRDNLGDNGGAIYNAGTLTVSNSSISNNQAGYGSEDSGGGIYNSGTLTLSNSTVSGNTAINDDGGGIYNGGTLTVTNSTIAGNLSGNGVGGGIANRGTLTVTNSTISDNAAPGGGGGIHTTGGMVVTVTGSTFSGNISGYGGGIEIFTSAVTVTNSTFTGNTGGGILNLGGDLTVINSTLTDNQGIGIENWYTLNLTNTIVAGNSDDLGGSGGVIRTNSHNLIGATPALLLGDLGANGGPTATQPLLPGSAAIGTGDPAVCAAAPVNGVDQRGVSRTAASCDIGAYQVSGTAPPAPTSSSPAATVLAGAAAAWIIGTTAQSGGYNIAQFAGGSWGDVSGAAVRIAVGPDGQPWVVNGAGSIFHRVNGAWQAVSGSAREIGVGADGSVWVIGTTAQPGGYQIWQYTGGGWSNVPGAAVRIAVGPDGQPWVINDAGSIYHRVNGAWQSVPGTAREIGVGAGGAVWIIGTGAQSGGYSIYQYSGSGWTPVDGAAVRIAVGADGQPWVINDAGRIFRRVNGAWQSVPGTAREIGVN